MNYIGLWGNNPNGCAALTYNNLPIYKTKALTNKIHGWI